MSTVPTPGTTTVIAAAMSDLDVDTPLRVTPAGHPAIAVIRTAEGVFAIDDTCTHQDTSLSDGWVEDCTVECPLHETCFDLRTGMPSGPPATRAVATHPVTVVDGLVHVDLAAHAVPATAQDISGAA